MADGRASSTEGPAADPDALGQDARLLRRVRWRLALWSGGATLIVLLALGSGWAVNGFGWLRRHTRAIQVFGGLLLIAVGIALVTGWWNDFVSWVRDAFVSDVRLPI